jgi:hypothetical protein
MPRRLNLVGERGGRGRRIPWPLVGGLVLWVVLAFVAADLDPAPRGEWLGRSRLGNRTELTRPWCPVCGAVEDNVTENRFVSGLAGVTQLILLSLPFAFVFALARRAGASEGFRRRDDEIEAERIERSMRRSQSRRARGP